MVLKLGVILTCLIVATVIYGCLVVGGRADDKMEEYFKEKE